ncbi:NAD(P)-binding protein [Aulographum hederae CBS 113979]|uniref:NAD(P)-binding protein n=1 Tax=Aulographum hederae CBS 113979 TaxID=1176131 RepID=A0A6G1H0T6_9PEZI|nr:NAD(P)-binding protein [Aulographum hederae CBS 113979]
MPYKLKDRSVLITGGSRGLGAVIARHFASQGSNIAINYLHSAGAAEKLAVEIRGMGVQACVIQADCGKIADCEKCVEETIKVFGCLDIIIGNAGWTKFSDFGDLNALSEEDWDKCWAVNVKGNLALLRKALPAFNSNPEGGCFIMTSSIAGTSTAGSSMAYSVTKCAQLHLMKCLAQTQGQKIRVNAVLPGLLLTEWGKKYPGEQIAALKERSVLKMETDLDDCADAFVMIAKNTSMTGQKIAVDAGLMVSAMSN